MRMYTATSAKFSDRGEHVDAADHRREGQPVVDGVLDVAEARREAGDERERRQRRDVADADVPRLAPLDERHGGAEGGGRRRADRTATRTNTGIEPAT